MREVPDHHASLRKKLATYRGILKTTLPARLAPWRAHVAALYARAREPKAWRAALPLLGFAVAYLVAYRYGNSLPSPAPLWPPDAILLSALLLTPPERWWRYLLIIIPIRLLPALAPGAPAWLLLLNLLNDAGKALLAALLVRRFAPQPLGFATLRAMTAYLLSAMLVAPFLSAFIGAAGLAAAHGAPYWLTWRTWFLGDALANLVLTPTILLWAAAGLPNLRSLSRRRTTELLLLGAALLAVALLALSGALLTLDLDDPLFYLPLLALVWAAVRFGPRGIASALTVVAAFAIANVTGLWGLSTPLRPAQEVLSLQLFLLVTATSLLLVAAQTEERADAETALRASEARFHAAFASTATGMMVVAPTGHILQVNRPIVEMLGYPEAELYTHTFMEITHPDDIAPNLALLHQTLAGERDNYQIEKRFLHKSGHLVWGRISAGLVRDAAGQPLYLVGLLEDITERKRLAQELTEQAEQLDRIVEAMREAVLVYDTHSMVVRTNAAARRMLSLDAAPPDYYRQPAKDRWALFMPRDQGGQRMTSAQSLVTRVLRGEDMPKVAETQDVQICALDGRELEVSASVAPLHDSAGQVIGAVVVLSDRTERNQLAREREAARARELALIEINKRLDTFVTIAAHDLKAPVGASMLTVQLTQRHMRQAASQSRPRRGQQPGQQTVPLAEVDHALETTRQGLDNLLRLVEQFMDVSRERNGTLILDRKPCQLDALIQDCVEEQRLLARNRVISLTLPAQPLPISADAVRIGRALTNYLTNARRYSPDHQPIDVRLLRCPEITPTASEEDATSSSPSVTPSTREVARIEVQDYGQGIPPEEQEAIWGRFQRAKAVEEATGLGLGLYIVKMTVERHGGSVGVESTPGQGSTFWFTLPLTDPSAAVDAPNPTPPREC